MRQKRNHEKQKEKYEEPENIRKLENKDITIKDKRI